jgi:hypothetical protein
MRDAPNAFGAVPAFPSSKSASNGIRRATLAATPATSILTPAAIAAGVGTGNLTGQDGQGQIESNGPR